MKQKDLELLSSYLDGQLSSADSARLEARLRMEPALRSVLQDLRGARSLLRQLPMRKAPRNFRLTPQMVGKNPPLPRAYPVFKFATSLATLLLFVTLSLNILGPQLAQPPALGMGGGGAPDTFSAEPAQEAAPATEAPAAAEEPSVAMAPMSTASAAAEDTARAMETTVTQAGEAESGISGVEQESPPAAMDKAAPQRPISPALQWILAGVALAGAFVMALMRQLAFNRWRSKK